MSHPFQTTRRMEFADTDAAGIVHFSRFFLFMEPAEHELLRSVGLSVIMPQGAGHLSWPRVSVQCDYIRPAYFENVLEIHVAIERLGDKSVTYLHDFWYHGEQIASGKITAVCCLMLPGQKPASQSIPPEIREKLSPFLLTP
jgi:4-hydroxybenzoyl-CoA thioesterase/acyl-CoA thioester hydrolase